MFKEIIDRNNNRTQGDWKFRFKEKEVYDYSEPYGLGDVIYLVDRYEGYAECGQDLRMEISKADREFIENAPNDISTLLKAASDLRKYVEHKNSCWPKTETSCSCGLDDLLKEME